MEYYIYSTYVRIVNIVFILRHRYICVCIYRICCKLCIVLVSIVYHKSYYWYSVLCCSKPCSKLALPGKGITHSEQLAISQGLCLRIAGFRLKSLPFLMPDLLSGLCPGEPSSCSRSCWLPWQRAIPWHRAQRGVSIWRSALTERTGPVLGRHCFLLHHHPLAFRPELILSF